MKQGLLSSAGPRRGFGHGEKFGVFAVDLEAASSCHRHTEAPSSAPAPGLTQNIQQGQRQILPRNPEQVQNLLFLPKSRWVFLVQLRLSYSGSWRLLCPKHVPKPGLHQGTGTSVIPVGAGRAWASRWAPSCALEQFSSS